MRRRMRNPRKLEELCFLASLRKESVVFYTEERPSWCTLNNVTRLLYTTRRLSFCNNINRDTYVISVTSGLQIRNIIRITGASNACLTADYECTPIQSSPPPPHYIDIIIPGCFECLRYTSLVASPTVGLRDEIIANLVLLRRSHFLLATLIL